MKVFRGAFSSKNVICKFYGNKLLKKSQTIGAQKALGYGINFFAFKINIFGDCPFNTSKLNNYFLKLKT
jgi:hypothetical protein